MLLSSLFQHLGIGAALSVTANTGAGSGLRTWFRHGIFNTFEHVFIRLADASATIAILWAFSPEVFSKLAVAQAWVAAALFLFVAPELVIYRDYSKWADAGVGELAARVRAFRTFAWLKAAAVFPISALLALALPGEGGFNFKFYSLVWAFFLPVGLQLLGPEREFLRLSLHLKSMNALVMYQKTALLAGTLWVALAHPGRVDLLALVALGVSVTAAFLGHWRVRKALRQLGATAADLAGRNGTGARVAIRESVTSFSGWHLFAGNVQNWILTMDVFFLGAFHLSPRLIGLFGAVVKLANFSLMVPGALGNLFQVWVGRRKTDGGTRERGMIPKLTGVLLVATVAQASVLYWASPWILDWLARGRWTVAEMEQMRSWLGWLLVGNVILGATHVLQSWVVLRRSISGFFFRVSVPWLLAAVALYLVAVQFGAFDAAAQVKWIVMGVYALLLAVFFRWVREPRVVRVTEQVPSYE